MRRTLVCFHALLMLTCLLVATPGVADTLTFPNTTFDLGDVGFPTYLSDPGMSASVKQALGFGNPAPSGEFIMNFPGSPNVDEGYQGLLQYDWKYNPGISGRITSIDFSEDKYIHTNGDVILTGSNIRMLLSQAGNYYIADIPVDVAFDTWEHGAGSRSANDFALFDFLTGTLDDTDHPDFSSGQMTFGMVNYYGLQLEGPVEMDT